MQFLGFFIRRFESDDRREGGFIFGAVRSLRLAEHLGIANNVEDIILYLERQADALGIRIERFELPPGQLVCAAPLPGS